MTRILGWGIPGALATMLLTGCASRSAVQREPTLSAREQSDRAAIARARADSARLPYVQADVDFMTGMIGHHAQAITMSRLAESHGANSSIRILAARIINAQQDEITIMQTWLKDRLKPVPEITATGTMRMGGMEHEHHMPGMLTREQMAQLDRARGQEFDRLFLSFMIQHHRGAVDMVQKLFGTYGAGQDEVVFKFASDVHVDQSTEIARMESMLANLKP
jgi:uncharacterized protein (DUF305 family)